MTFHSRRVPALFLTTLALCLLLAFAPGAATAEENTPLTLTAAADLAVAAQPLLEAQRASIVSAQENAVAAAQLPDPTLVGGLTDLTLTGRDRFTLTDESDTQFMLGVKQSFPGGNKRQLRGARGEAEASRLSAELEEQRRMLRRETGLAWLEVWKAQRAQKLVQASIAEAQRQRQAVDINYRAGIATQADWFGAGVAVELLTDQLANMQQQEWHARNQLRRWIGTAADRPLAIAPPTWPEPDTRVLLAQLERHPHVAAQSRAVAVAETEMKLAQAEYRPDWSLQAGYGYRPEFADYVSLQFEVALPWFTRNRQDRAVAASAAGLSRAESLKEDWLRQHRAEIQLNATDWQRLRARLQRYDAVILPQTRSRLEAAQAAYATGRGTLLALLDARRSLLDIHMQQLDLRHDAARHQVALEYFSALVTGETQS